jgi:hypothetical protein
MAAAALTTSVIVTSKATVMETPSIAPATVLSPFPKASISYHDTISLGKPT